MEKRRSRAVATVGQRAADLADAQEELLGRLAAAAGEVDVAARRRDELIREVMGLQPPIMRQRIAERAGVSVGRLYQIAAGKGVG